MVGEVSGAERAFDGEIVDGEADAVLDFGGSEACGGFEGGAVEDEIAIVVGEA